MKPEVQKYVFAAFLDSFLQHSIDQTKRNLQLLQVANLF